jgi:hypothetical protein
VCTARCQFDGMDCLPGGTLEGSFAPGEVEVVVQDPSASGGKRPVRVPIAVGHRTTFECRADAKTPTPMPE